MKQILNELYHFL